MAKKILIFKSDGRKKPEDIKINKHYVYQFGYFVKIVEVLDSEEDGYGVLLENGWDRTPDEEDMMIPVYLVK